MVAFNHSKVNPALLVADVLTAELGDFTQQGPGELTFSSTFLRRALLEARKRKLAGFLTVHTHPFSGDEVEFSSFDNFNDPKLMANLYDLKPDGIFGSVVAGKASLNGRVWNPRRGFETLSSMVTIGEQYVVKPLDGSARVDLPLPNAIFDRSLAVTGAGALSVLSGLRIGLVGASGTGSIFAEQLLRAGAGSISVFEFDIADDTNLGRVLHLRLKDVVEKRQKAQRIKEVVDESGLPTKATVVPRTATSGKQRLPCTYGTAI